MTHKSNALILIDIQNDFLPGGPLAISNGDEIISVVNRLVQYPFDCIVATKDWHPPNHVSFAETHAKKCGEKIFVNGIEQILWPIHCLKNTPGADFHPALDTKKIDRVFLKGTDPFIDSYSAFFDNIRQKSTGLEDFLKMKEIKTVYLVGLALDYCVKYSALDASFLGLEVYVVLNGCRGLNLQAKDTNNALDMMKKAGAKLINSAEINLT